MIVQVKDLEKENETEKAILFSQDDILEWIPKNEIVYSYKDENAIYKIHIPLWLAAQKEFDYEEID